MASLLDSLSETLTPREIEQISKKIGSRPRETRAAIEEAMPMLVAALGRQAANPKSAAGLQRALAEDHDGSLVDQLDDYLGGRVGGRQANGAGILENVLGDRRPAAEKAVAQKSGLDLGSIGPLLQLLAPIVMGMLAKKQRSSGGSGGGLGDLFGVLEADTTRAAREKPEVADVLGTDWLDALTTRGRR